VFLEFLHGSWGGRPDRDGIDACSSVVANFSNNPIEQLEAEYPLRIEQYGFVPDRGGAGKYRGGLAGGKSGAPSSNFLISGEQTRQLASKDYLMLHRGDLLRHTLAGAGGHGDPFERDPARVAADVVGDRSLARGPGPAVT
jgi:N-methylhydantoinase B